MGNKALAVQVPMDKLVKGKEWDFFTQEGKDLLEERELDPNLKASHWAPDCKTFSRGRWIRLEDGSWIEGPKQVRSSEEPWGFGSLGRNDSIKVRQGNAMARRSILGLKSGLLQGLFPSLEHPYMDPTSGKPQRSRSCWRLAGSTCQSIRRFALEAGVRSGHV